MCDHIHRMIFDDQSGYCLDCGLSVPDRQDARMPGPCIAGILAGLAATLAAFWLYFRVMC